MHLSLPESNDEKQPASRASSGLRLALILAILAGLATLLMWWLGEAQGAARAPLRVSAIGHNWWWEFHYPELGFKTANELHLPSSTEILMEVRTVDVTHTLSIPELGIQANALPGATQQVTFRIDEAGAYGGECSEICGIAHNMMRLKLVAQSPEDFATWVASQQQPAALPQSERQQAGYDMLTTACAKCHSLDPAETRTDLVGPNLAHLMSRSVFAGASFTLNHANLRSWIRDTQAMKAGNDMKINLPPDDYEAVIQYLLQLK